MDDVLKTDLAYMVNDLRETLDEEAFEGLTEVLKESLGEFLMTLYYSSEEPLTVETMIELMKKIVTRRFDEV
jgi:hypothetical protein